MACATAASVADATSASLGLGPGRGRGDTRALTSTPAEAVEGALRRSVRGAPRSAAMAFRMAVSRPNLNRSAAAWQWEMGLREACVRIYRRPGGQGER